MYTPISYLAVASFLCRQAAHAQSLPQVDLGYEIHQAIELNETAQTYNFTNIRFAQPPVGKLRFAAPVKPEGRNTEVVNGSTLGRICPQAAPAWGGIAAQFIPEYINGTADEFNYTQAVQLLQLYLASTPPSQPDPRTSEDCLFLDVVVPKKIFDNANNRHRRRNNAGAPVLVWIYGGGYALGSKDASGSPNHLINASQADGSDGIIFVAMNYRLGALGFLGGPSLQAAGGVANAALYDQRLAIEWVAENIHLFGGDPNRITLIGESAGGGSIEHQITAFGGQQGVSFQQAIPQSPAFAPIASNFFQENATQNFLALLNVSTIEEAQNASSAAVIRANALQIGAAPYGTFVYGPSVDGVFVPSLPGQLFARGQFAKNVTIMVGHNTHETPSFTPPYISSNADIKTWAKSSFPGISDTIADYLVNVLYPADYNGSQTYTSPLERAFRIVSDSAFVCNTNYINKAYNNQTWAYEFQVPPALHGQDVAYTFYQGTGTNLSAGLIAPVAEALQGYITNFAKNGNPNGPGLPFFPIQGSNATMQGINATYIQPQTDDTVNARCAWWQQALFY